MSNQHGLHISGLLILHEEARKNIAILWKRPNEQKVNITIRSVMIEEIPWLKNDGVSDGGQGNESDDDSDVDSSLTGG
jgi:hypothetical protein